MINKKIEEYYYDLSAFFDFFCLNLHIIIIKLFLLWYKQQLPMKSMNRLVL